jgi:anaerobic ribonucleoside-triphosphate reductase
MSEEKELTAEEWLETNEIRQSATLWSKGGTIYEVSNLMEEYTKAKTEEKDKQLMHYAVNVCPEKDREIDELQKEVERLKGFETLFIDVLNESKRRSDEIKEGVLPSWLIEMIKPTLNKELLKD